MPGRTILEIPARYGIYMPIGDSLGPGGIMARLPQRAPPLRNRPAAAIAAEVARDPVTSSTTRTRRRFEAAGDAPPAAPSVKSFGLLLVRRACEQSRVGWPGRPASRPEADSRWPPVVGGIKPPAPRSQALRLVDGTDAMPLVLGAARKPSRSSSGRSRPTASCPTAGRNWTEFFPQMQRLEGPLRPARSRNVGDALRHQRRTTWPYEACPRGANSRASATSWTAPGGRSRHAPPTCPWATEDEGHRGHRRDRGDRPANGNHHARRESPPTTARSRNLPERRESSRSTPRSQTPTAVRPIHAGPAARGPWAAHLRHYGRLPASTS